MVVCDLDGDLVEGDLRAVLSDTAAHAYVYRHMPEVGGVVHTHSTYATAWAARGEPIPCVLTMIADEFGGEIPVGPFALIGDDSIGRGIVETLRGQPLAGRADAQPRRLHHRHGRPRRGQGRRDVEDVARTVHSPASSASRSPIAQADVDALYDRYQNVYGQQATEELTDDRPPTREVWFLTGSQDLYGDDVLDQVADQSAADRRDARRPRRHPGPRSSGSRCSPTPTRSAALMLDANADDRCVGVIAWMHTFSPGQDVDRRPRRAAQAAAAPAHAGQRRRCRGPTIDMDFMNLNQAAHGDREFGYIQTRLGVARKTVAGHVERPGGRRRGSARWARAARGLRASCATLRLARFGDNMRDVAVTEGDKVEAELRFGVSVNTYGVNDLVAVVDAVADADGRRAGRRVRGPLRRRARAAPRRRPARVAALRRPRSSSACATFLDDGGFTRVHHQLRGPRRAAPAARAWPCSG